MSYQQETYLKAVHCPADVCDNTCSWLLPKAIKPKQRRARPVNCATVGPLEEDCACRPLKDHYEAGLSCENPAQKEHYIRSGEYEVAQMMIEFVNKGVHICDIDKALAEIKVRWLDKTGSYDINAGFNQERVKTALKYDKVLKDALRTLLNLKPAFPEAGQGEYVLQRMLAPLNDQFRFFFEDYCYLLLLQSCGDDLKAILGWHSSDFVDFRNNPAVWMGTMRNLFPPDKIRSVLKSKIRPARASDRNLWDQSIVTIVNELRRVGYADGRAYKKTARRLHLRYQQRFPDDPDRVKQRYGYHSKTHKE